MIVKRISVGSMSKYIEKGMCVAKVEVEVVNLRHDPWRQCVLRNRNEAQKTTMSSITRVLYKKQRVLHACSNDNCVVRVQNPKLSDGDARQSIRWDSKTLKERSLDKFTTHNSSPVTIFRRSIFNENHKSVPSLHSKRTIVHWVLFASPFSSFVQKVRRNCTSLNSVKPKFYMNSFIVRFWSLTCPIRIWFHIRNSAKHYVTDVFSLIWIPVQLNIVDTLNSIVLHLIIVSTPNIFNSCPSSGSSTPRISSRI